MKETLKTKINRNIEVAAKSKGLITLLATNYKDVNDTIDISPEDADLAAGSLSIDFNSGHVKTTYRGKQTTLHAVIADRLFPNRSPDLQVDHIDGNPRNNTRSNLRLLTKADNIRFAKKARGKLPRGVKTSGSNFYAGINVDGRDEVVAICKTIDEAARWYNAAAFARYGVNADFNSVAPLFPEGVVPIEGQYFWRSSTTAA
jgi:HNH endonuclease